MNLHDNEPSIISNENLLLLSVMVISPKTYTTPTPLLAQGMTTLTDKSVKYQKLDSHYVIMKQADISMIVVDNQAVDIPELPGHQAGYNGVASLKHSGSDSNLFVPAYAGLNFEHIHDGTTRNLIEKFEPRKFPMELRLINSNTVEVYQPATGNWQLESCGRYSLQKMEPSSTALSASPENSTTKKVTSGFSGQATSTVLTTKVFISSVDRANGTENSMD